MNFHDFGRSASDAPWYGELPLDIWAAMMDRIRGAEMTLRRAARQSIKGEIGDPKCLDRC